MTGSFGHGIRRGRRVALGFLGVLVSLVLASSASAATGWTGPGLVSPAGNCYNVSAAIDSTGSYHVVADCGGRIRYTTDDSGEWSTVYFAVPVDFADQRPQIAIDGDRIWVGYTRVMFLACGIDYVGVYVRSRTLTNATWSAPRRIGFAGDNLRSFRAVDGVLHLTVSGDNAYYETWTSTALTRYQLTDGTGGSSLRIGSDGRARIVYETASALRYAVFNGSGFTKSTIPGTTVNDRDPLLVLDANNRAHVVWTHVEPPSCSDAEVGSADGTYYATNRTGSWSAIAGRRVTNTVGAPSLTVDTATGRVHLLVGAETGLTYYTRTSGGAWIGQKLSSAKVQSTSLRLDQDHASLLAVYSRQPDTGVSASIFAFTKP